MATTYPYLARTRTRCTWGPLLVLLLSFTLKLSANEVSMNGAFSSEQAELGSHLFSANCSQCHTGIQVADLALARWNGRRLGDLFERVTKSMPPEGAKLQEQQYLDILAWVFTQRGFAAGHQAMLTGDTAWRGIVIEANNPESTKADGSALEWTAYRGNLLSQGYSPADQIDRSNVRQLKIAWRWSARNFGPTPEFRNTTTPLMISGVLYFTAGVTRDVVAVDAGTGETLWIWRPQESQERFDQAPRKGSGRGVAYWRGDDREASRVFVVTPGFELVALNAESGTPVTNFGDSGRVDLKIGLRVPLGATPDIGSTSPPLVMGDVVVVGPALLPGMRAKSRANVKGDVRAFDARTGKLLWTFKTIPDVGEASAQDWGNGSALYTGNAGVWAPMSGDAQLGLIYLSVSPATNDYFGGARPGRNKYANSLVCLDVATGRMRWFFQVTHHDLWDWDLPAAPMLMDIPQQNGQTIRAVAEVTKQAFLYVFERTTGKPIWPIVERPVPKSTVPGELSWPTQPVPTKPAPFDLQQITEADVIDFTPAIHAKAVALLRNYDLGKLYAPPTLAAPYGKERKVIKLPSNLGGANWQGGAVDPESAIVYVGSMTVPEVDQLEPAPTGSDAGYVLAENPLPNLDGLPLIKPPWGRITAIDLKSGEHLWMRPNGEAPQRIKNHPALKDIGLPPTGKPTRAGLLVTKTLLFAGEGWPGDPVLRVHDKSTGEVLAEIPLPGTQIGLPMSYVWQGRQYIALTVGNGEDPAELVSLSLP